ncbi:MAG: M23 family metallopeptidase [Lysinibacillus sp.]
MREDKNNRPSQKVQWQKKAWFWPAIYAGSALILIGMLFSYNALVSKEEQAPIPELAQVKPNPIVETNAKTESLMYPFKEAKLKEIQVIQDFYDMGADEKARENALMVFNQSFSTSSGLSISMDAKEFEVLAAMSGEVVDVKLDALTGNTVMLKHPNGMETHYSSLKDIQVKKGEKITQGQQLGIATENEWNPTAGIHMHFEVLEDGKYINPRKILAF